MYFNDMTKIKKTIRGKDYYKKKSGNSAFEPLSI